MKTMKFNKIKKTMQETKRNRCKIILFYPNLHEINQDHQEFIRQVLVNTLIHARSKISKFLLQESFQDCNFDSSFFCSFFYMF